MNPVLCQDVFDLARKTLEETTCNCHVEGGACARCLVDRNNYKYASLLSKAKVLDWLNRQKNKAFDIPTDVQSFSPTSKVVYQSLKDVVKQAIKDSEVKKISLFASDITDDYTITDWASLRSEWVSI